MSGPLSRSPSGRTPEWARDEAHQKEVQRLVEAMHGGGSETPRGRKPRRKSRDRADRAGHRRLSTARTVLVLCASLAVVGAGIHYASPTLLPIVSRAILGEQFHEPDLRTLDADSKLLASGYPPRGAGAEKEPLGKPAALVQSSDSHAFLVEDRKGGLTAYDPCRPIHYVTRPDNAPPDGQAMIAEAVAAASAATGLVFIDDGPTTEDLVDNRSYYQPDRYGKKWAPVLIVWETPEEQPRFVLDPDPNVSNLAGLGGSQPITGDAGSQVFVTGAVQLNAPLFHDLLARPNGRAIAGGIIQHELGHVLGLDHVQDPSQLMYEHGQNEVTTYAAGDLTGLAQLGQGKCFPNH